MSSTRKQPTKPRATRSKGKRPLRGKKIQFNVNEKENEILFEYAELRDISVAEVLREYIKQLPIKAKALKSTKVSLPVPPVLI